MKKHKLNNAIIGKGYIGKFIKKKTNIKNIFDSKNIENITKQKFNII